MCIIGLAGMLVISIISIAESKTGTIESFLSALPVSILFASLFIAGYVALSKKDN